MGNHGSKRKHRKHIYDNDEHNEEEAGNLDDFAGTTPDSYDKLLAWMIEMAQNDDVNLQSPTFVEHLTTVCADKRSRFSRANTATTRQHSLDVPSVVRQHSYDSSCSSSRNSRASRSREDLLDARTRFRRSMLSRQATVDYSDEGDGAVSHMDISSGSSFDHDSDLDSSGPQSLLIRNIGETSFTKSVDIPNHRQRSTQYYSDNGFQNISNSVGDLLHGKCNINSGVRKKSKSLMTMRRMMSETRNDDEITPITEETVVKVLDDKILDSNMADILFSVEALWPKIPNTK